MFHLGPVSCLSPKEVHVAGYDGSNPSGTSSFARLSALPPKENAVIGDVGSSPATGSIFGGVAERSMALVLQTSFS